MTGAIPVSADVGPPVEIRLPRQTTVPARSGVDYSIVMEVVVGANGTINAFEVTGDGWVIASVSPRAPLNVRVGEVVPIRVEGRTTDADKPLHVHLTFDGQTIAKSFRVSAERFEAGARAARAVKIDGRDAAAAAAEALKLPAQRFTDHRRTSPPGGGDDPAVPHGGAIHLHVRGRIVYQRTDGPILGADSMWYQIMDDDSPAPDEEMYSGFTDQDGNFDVQFDWDDCDALGCDDPDIYLRFETDNGVVIVERADLFEENYSWSTEDTQLYADFTGNFIDFGTVMPANMGQHPAVHISNSIVRAHRYVAQIDGTNVAKLDVEWPEDPSGPGAYYNPSSQTIHVTASRQWNEISQGHEYGHHFLNLYSQNTTPNYCNGICDSGGCGHCVWCPENVTDAWNEGWPNWLGSIVARNYPAAYGIIPWAASNDFANRYNMEQLDTCGAAADDATTTEGYASALLFDMDDANQDDEDGGAPDCSMDAMSGRQAQIFQVVRLDQPTTIQQFINAYWARYPLDVQDFWSTVRNISLVYSLPSLPPPVITPQPINCHNYTVGEDVTLTVVANGALLHYQWRHNGAALAESGHFTGATTSVLTVHVLTTADAGLYDCLVSTCDNTQSSVSPPFRITLFGGIAPGPVAAWGLNSYGACVNGTQVSPAAPGTCTGLSNIVAVSGSQFHMAAVKADGTVWCEGYNGGYGAVGDPDTSHQFVLTPFQVPGVQDVVAIRVGGPTTYAIKKDGTLWGWGYNGYGQVNGAIWPNSVSIPRSLPLDCVVDASVNIYYSVAVKSDGTVWTWGLGNSGQLGDGPDHTFRTMPGPVTGLSGVVAVAAGSTHVLALKDDGTAWAWGAGSYLGVGENAPSYQYTPVQVIGLTNVIAVAVPPDGGRSYAVTSDGHVWVWGSNGFGSLGLGDNGGFYYTPVQHPTLSNIAGIRATNFAMFARTNSGVIWAAGSNQNGVLGAISEGTYWYTPQLLPFLSHTTSIATGEYTVWAMGTLLNGDVNGDGIEDGRDVQPFVNAILSSAPAGGALAAADFNGNGVIDVGDIAPFVAKLLNP